MTTGTTIRERQKTVIARLMTERDALKTQLANRPVRVVQGKMRRCVYCGWASRGITCHAHRDLLALDPHYAP